MNSRRFLLIALIIYPLYMLSQTLSLREVSASESNEQGKVDAGKILYQQGRYDEALTTFQQAVREAGKSAEAHYWLGRAWFALGENNEALKAFRRTVQLDRKWASAHAGMGMVYARRPNRRLDARKAYRRAVEIDPGNADVQYRMGMTYMDQERSGRLIGSDRDGRKYFSKAVELNPTHPDAYFQLGRCYDSPDEPETENALSAYMQQYRVYPEHSEALLSFANVSHRTERYDLGAEELRATIREWGEDTPDRIRTMLSQFEVLALGSDQQFDRLQEALESYISQLDTDEQAVYRDLSHVAPPDELKAWEAATGPEREVLWLAFWNERDSNPATIENERLVEHYRRVMYARIHFSEKKFPYDRRGEIHVRYGEPDDRRRFMVRANEDPYALFMASDNPAVDAIREQNLQFGYQLKVNRGEVSRIFDSDKKMRSGFGAPTMDDDISDKPPEQLLYEQAVKQRREMGSSYMAESWVYVPHKLELFFVDQMGGGRFDYPLETLTVDESSDQTIQPSASGRQDMENPRRRAAELIARSPEVYAHDFGGEPLEYAFDAVSFRGEGGSTEVDMVYSIPIWQFGDITDEKGDRTWLDNQVTLRDSVQTPAFSRKFRFGPIARPERQAAIQEFQGAAYPLAANQ
ncbi:MAG: tetratricopeptide repeat protein, partial [Gemmatimonadetes bacterium]|nr:tetratricopeptide repeat protein [Gemmatimonadota bacterium]